MDGDDTFDFVLFLVGTRVGSNATFMATNEIIFINKEEKYNYI